MGFLSKRSWVVAVALLGIALAWAPAAAQHSKTVGGFVVNLGIVSAELALSAEGHRDAHPLHPPSGSQHLLITLDEVTTASGSATPRSRSR